MPRSKKLTVSIQRDGGFTVREFAEALGNWFKQPVSENMLYSYIRRGWIKNYTDERTKRIMVPNEELAHVIKRGHIAP